MKHKQMFDAYVVYENGNVVNKNSGRQLKPDVNSKNGYSRVTLCHNGKTSRFLVHRLVAMLFIPNPENKPCVNHRDGNKNNNAVSNLEWSTYSENEYHSYRELGKQVPKGTDRWNSKFSDEQIAEIKEHASRSSYRNTAKVFKCSHQYVSELMRNKKR